MPCCRSVAPKGGLPRAVALATALQFGGQLLGIACASTADRFGAVPLLVLHCGAGAGRLPRRAAAARPAAASAGRSIAGFWRSVGEGVSAAAKSDQIWPVLLLNFGVGVFYVGPFMAVLPLVVRDNYAGGALELSYVNLAFWAGDHRRQHGAGRRCARRLTLRGRLIGGAGARRRDRAAGARDAAAVPGVRGAELRLGARGGHHHDAEPHGGADRGAGDAPRAADVAVPARPGRRRSDRRLPDRVRSARSGAFKVALLLPALAMMLLIADRAGPLAPLDDADGGVGATPRRRAGRGRSPASARRPAGPRPAGSCPRRHAAASA